MCFWGEDDYGTNICLLSLTPTALCLVRGILSVTNSHLVLWNPELCVIQLVISSLSSWFVLWIVWWTNYRCGWESARWFPVYDLTLRYSRDLSRELEFKRASQNRVCSFHLAGLLVGFNISSLQLGFAFPSTSTIVLGLAWRESFRLHA